MVPINMVHVAPPPVTPPPRPPAQTRPRPPIPETFRNLRRVCGDPASAPACLDEIGELERDVESRLAKDALAKMRMKCVIDHDPCDPDEM